MFVVRMIKRFFKNLVDPVMMGVCSNVLAAVYMLTAMYSINADVPDRVLTNRALTAILGIGVAMLVYFWILYIHSVLVRWKAEGFTFSLKLDVDEEDENVEYVEIEKHSGKK